MDNIELAEKTNSIWKEKIYLETAEFVITGDVFQPNIGKQNRMITEILNSKKEFIAIKDCTIEHKSLPNRELEHHEFIQVNRSKIIIMRPADES